MTEAHFFSVAPGSHPFQANADILCETGNALDLYLPIEGIYSVAAQKFGDFLANNANAELVKQKLQLYGYLVERVASYANQGAVSVGGTLFPRIVSAVLRISKPDNSTCGYLLRSVWLEAHDDDEDGDLANRKNTAEKKMILMDRKCNRNPNAGLDNLFHKKTHLKFKEEAKFTPFLWFHRLTREIYVRDFAARIVEVKNHDVAIKFTSLAADYSNNPARLSEVYSLRMALAAMKLDGCDQSFLNENCFANNSLDFNPVDLWRIDPKELVWSRLQSTFFPDRPPPTIDTNSAQFQHALQHRAAAIEANAPPEVQGASPAEQKLFKEECLRRATQDVTAAFQSAMHIKLETANRDLLAAANEKRIADAMAEARQPREGDTPQKVHDRIGLARYNAQVECLSAFKVLWQQDASLDQSYVAVRDHMANFLEKNNNSLYWEHEWSPHFSNLTDFGKLMALFNLWSEADGCYMVHRQTLAVWLAALHVPFRCKLQPNLLITGTHAIGKSRVLNVAQARMIPKTWKSVSGSSDKSDLSATGAFLLNNKAKFCEELPPSDLGLDSGSNKSSGTAMTDKSSRFRAMATDEGKIGYDRLVQNPETNRYELESLDLQLNRVLLGCLNLQPHEIPGNVLSRFVCLQFMQYQRAGHYQLASCKLYQMPEEFKPLVSESNKRAQWLQGVLWIYALHLTTKSLHKPDFSVTQLFVEEVILLAKERGVNGVNDYRILDHIHSLIEMVAIMQAVWKFYSDPDSKLKNLQYDERECIDLEKVVQPKIEHAAFILTLLSDQFESNVATEVLSAISVTFSSSPYHKQALAQYNARRKGGDNDGDVSDDDIGPDPRQDAKAGGGDGINAIFSEYFDFQIEVGKLDNLRAGERVNHLCNKLAEVIDAKFVDKPGRGSVVHYLHGLTTQTVPTSNRKANIPCLVLKDNGQCQIAKVMLRNLSNNRMVACVQEVLSRRLYPQQRYTLGVCSAKAPFLWKTFSTNPDDLPTQAEKKRYKVLADLAERVRHHQLATLTNNERDEQKLAVDKKRFLESKATIAFRFAAHEKAVWNALASRTDADHVLFGEGTQFTHTVEVLDTDREDFGAVKWLGNTVYLTPSVARKLICVGSTKDLQPSVCRAKSLREHKQTVERMVQVLVMKQRVDVTEAQRKQIVDRCRYPSAFESGKPTDFRKKAMRFAVQNPEKFSMKAKAMEMADIAGLGFVFDGDGKEAKAERESKRQQQQPMQEDPPMKQEPQDDQQQQPGGAEQKRDDQERPPTPPRTPSPPRSPGPDDTIGDLLRNATPQQRSQRPADPEPFVLEQDDTSLPAGGLPLRQVSSGESAMDTNGDAAPAPRAAPNTPNRKQKKKKRTREDEQLDSNKRQRGEQPPARLRLQLRVVTESGPSGSIYEAYKAMEAQRLAQTAMELDDGKSSNNSSPPAPSTPSPQRRSAAAAASPGNAPIARRKPVRAAVRDPETKKKKILEMNEHLGDSGDYSHDEDYDADAGSDEEQQNEEEALLDDTEEWDRMDELVDSEEERELRGEDIIGEGEAGQSSAAQIRAEEEAATALSKAEERENAKAAREDLRREKEEAKARKAAKNKT